MKKVFISYSADDLIKARSIRKAISNWTGHLEALVIVDRKGPGVPLTEKVIDGIRESDVLVPIMTQHSLGNQWVNQEIGLAIGMDRTVVPIVASNILDDLKGLIHKQIDLPFTFDPGNTPSADAANFRKCCRELIYYLINIGEDSYFEADISPRKVRKGNGYKTSIVFRGNLQNGFFTSRLTHKRSGRIYWRPDPETKTGGKHKPGPLNGDVSIRHSFKYSTEDLPRGQYTVLVGAWNHLVPGQKGRKRIRYLNIDMEIV